MKRNMGRSVGLLLAVAMICMMLGVLARPLKAEAATYTIWLDEALHNSNFVYNTVREYDEIWLTLEEAAQKDDRLLGAYLEGKTINVYIYNPVTDDREKLTPDSEGKYRWTVPSGVVGTSTSVYLDVVGGDLFTTKEYTIRKLESQNAGERVIDLRSGTRVPLTSKIESVSESETRVISQTFGYKNAAEGVFSYSHGTDPEEEVYYDDIDLDQNGTMDIRFAQASFDYSIGWMMCLPTCSIDGDYVIKLSDETMHQADLEGRPYYGSLTLKLVKFEKKTNTLKVKGRTATVRYSKLRKKTQTLTRSKVITFTKKGWGTITYSKTSGNKKITISKNTGKVTVKKGLKKGTYTVKFKVKASGDDYYKAGSQTVKAKIRVK